MNSRYTIAQFMPLIGIFLLILGFTLLRMWYTGGGVAEAMNDFMAGFFLVFGGFKLLKLSAFAEAYTTYDIIAKRSIWYAYAYPFIEIFLGLAYLFRFNLPLTNSITAIVMAISAIGVGIELAKNKEIMCACLGTVFKIPMTYVTLLEDLLMLGMALWGLLGS